MKIYINFRPLIGTFNWHIQSLNSDHIYNLKGVKERKTSKQKENIMRLSKSASRAGERLLTLNSFKGMAEDKL